MVSAGQNPTDEELEEMIRIADADGTGDIDFAEFVTLMAHRIADEKSEETLRAAFSVFDTSGDGFINAEEMRRIMMHMGEPVTLEDVDQVIRKVDRDGDGVIDYNEFTKVTCLLASPQAQASSRRQRVLGAPSCAGVAPVRRRDVADAADSCGCARLTGHHGRASFGNVRFFEDQVSDLRSDLVAARSLHATLQWCVPRPRVCPVVSFYYSRYTTSCPAAFSTIGCHRAHLVRSYAQST
jgi:calmodulin